MARNIPADARRSRRASHQPSERRAFGLENFVSQLDPQPRRLIESASDELQAARLHSLNLGRLGQIQLGVVVNAMPYINWYRVLLDSGDAACSCCKGSLDAGTGSVGIHDSSTLPPQTLVLVYKPPALDYGIILCAVPTRVADGAQVFPDWIVQGSGVGFKREAYQGQALKLLARGGGAVDYSNGRPLDSTCWGEFGRFSELGGGIFLDAFQAFLRIDETCGLFAYYFDRLMRLTGHGLDIRSAIHEEIYRNDSGEGHQSSGSTPYPWEALGVFLSGTSVTREVDPKESQFREPYATVEPRFDDQMPFWRYEEYRGYLGQAAIRQVAVPNPSLSTTTVNRRDSTDYPAIGVFREQIGLDGSYALQSAHSILIQKRILIPIPKQKRLPEDISEEADDLKSDNYKFAGQYGNGPDHKVGNLDAESSTPLPHFRTAAGLMDFHAHVFNWKALHPFHYHKGDYTVPGQDKLSPFTKLQVNPGFNQLTTATWLDRPQAVKLMVDHRYKEQSYYETTAGISILPDGSMVQHDGYGSEIKMVGGNMILSPPGDVILAPGRSLVVLAGDDIILRARNSVDITSSDKDVRIKAEHNMQVLAGNSGIGGILLESRAQSPMHVYEKKVGEDVFSSGIILKAEKSQVISWAREVFVQTTDGPIVLDAGKGKQDILTVSRQFNRHIESQANDSFTVDNKTVVHQHSGAEVLLNAPVIITGDLAVIQGVRGVGRILAERGITSVLGFFMSGVQEGLVPKMTSESLGRQREYLTEIKDHMKKVLEEQQKDYDEQIVKRYYEQYLIGNDEHKKQIEVGMRNDDQLRTTQFKIPASRWQQMAKVYGAGQPWRERDITYHGKAMQPYPGKENWEGPTLLEADMALHDIQTGLDKPLTDIGYENSKFDAWQTSAPPSSAYLVIP